MNSAIVNILELIRKQYPNSQEVIIDEIKSHLEKYEEHVFSKVHDTAFKSGQDLGYRLGLADGETSEKLKQLNGRD